MSKGEVEAGMGGDDISSNPALRAYRIPGCPQFPHFDHWAYVQIMPIWHDGP